MINTVKTLFFVKTLYEYGDNHVMVCPTRFQYWTISKVKKTFFMLNSANYEIYYAHVKMPT